VITSDVIVGFPGETERDFLQTMELIERLRFDALFTFIYSPRPGAPSALVENNTPRGEIQRRFERLVNRQNEISEEKHREYVGKTVRVLIDGETGDAQYPLASRTGGNRLVKLKSGTLGQFADVLITGSGRWSLTADNN
jgi:tRNA-2-methylthio-N6-dimethylallyladenosine synthase